jgi:hypothetical protein
MLWHRCGIPSSEFVISDWVTDVGPTEDDSFGLAPSLTVKRLTVTKHFPERVRIGTQTHIPFLPITLIPNPYRDPTSQRTRDRRHSSYNAIRTNGTPDPHNNNSWSS